MADRRPEPHLKSILELTRGILFLGIPHQGSSLAKWAEMLAKSIGILKQTNVQIVQVLKSESEVLARVQDGFHTMIRARAAGGHEAIEITCFYEELPLPGVGTVSRRHMGSQQVLIYFLGCANAFSNFTGLYSNRNTR